MKVKFKKLRENAKLPTKAHNDDFCYDVYACDCEEVAPNVYKYPLGFAYRLTKMRAFHYQIVICQCLLPCGKITKQFFPLISVRGVQYGKPEWFLQIVVVQWIMAIPGRLVHFFIT